MLGTLLTLWSIRLASVCFAVVMLILLPCVFLKSPDTDEVDRPLSRRTLSCLRCAWSIGCVLSALHLVFAFAFYHHWSHAAAVADTATKTNALIGISFGGGVWFNYLFVAVWLADMIYWWIRPQGYLNEGTTLRRWVYIYLGFIMFNGVVVFGTGYTRVTGIVFCAMLAAILISRLRKSALQEFSQSDESGD